MKYEKLVRDRIPEIIEKKGEIAETHIAEEKEFKEMLRKKLDEEIEEFDKEPSAHELADTLEVLQALAIIHDFKWERVKEILKKKTHEDSESSEPDPDTDEKELRLTLRDEFDAAVAEFDKAHDAYKMADILGVLQALARAYDIKWDRVKEVQHNKAKERGGFEQRIILDRTTKK